MPTLGDIVHGRDINTKCKGAQYAWLACLDCGKERWVQLRKGQPKHTRCLNCGRRTPDYRQKCSRRPKLYGTDNPAWKGGKTKVNGYILIRFSPKDPFLSMTKETNNYVLEHRLVMAQHLGRCLKPWEIVHHRNGIRFDNTLSNLELLPKRKYHIVDTVTKSLLKHQALKLEEQAKQIRLLTWRIKQLEGISTPKT